MVEDGKAAKPLLKWIVCRIVPGRRPAYAEAQERWAPVAACDGFLGQLGGWTASDDHVACVLAFWRDAKAYADFMANDHDGIAERAGIAPTIEAGSATIFRRLMDIPGERANLEEAMPEAAFLRVADCRLSPGREARFLEKQTTTWNPGMGGCAGMLAGAVGRADADASRYLVASLWASKEAHENYMRRVFPALRSKAKPDEEIDALEGRRVELLPSWLVEPRRQGA